ncbi:hypothetical protein Ahy_A06g027450 isoform A [Arachis hypogaea]|uniref:DUF223 domain-containing protein n=1 Tax=Arachis hypogaea TaxID=3818 RepID=A0A445CNP1_ARAHY|nr:hypothetical protein Ahy_A06g027450 isoform A [Arachis hypogaea]
MERTRRQVTFKWILVFTHRTIVNHVQNPSFPLVAWHLNSIAELLTVEKVEESELFVEVVGKEDLRDLITSKRMKTKHFVESSIPCVGVHQNVRNNRINCILFGDMVDLILPHVEDGRLKPLIMSHFYVSNLHFDIEIKVAGFRSRMLCGTTSSFARISQVSLQGRWLGVEDLNQRSAVAKIIVEIAATIVSINASKSDWYYKSYRRCPKKVDTSIGKRYECTKILPHNIVDKMALFKINKNGCRNLVDMSGHVVNLKTDIDPHFSMITCQVASVKFQLKVLSVG